MINLRQCVPSGHSVPYIHKSDLVFVLARSLIYRAAWYEILPQLLPSQPALTWLAPATLGRSRQTRLKPVLLSHCETTLTFWHSRNIDKSGVRWPLCKRQ